MKALRLLANPNFRSFLKEEAGYMVDKGVNGDYIESGRVAVITEEQADFLETVSAEMYQMSLQAIDKVIVEGRFAEFGVGPLQADLIKASWDRRGAWGGEQEGDPELYGRFDFSWDGKKSAKFYEFNGDTPTTAYECAVVQWVVVEDYIKRGVLPAHVSQFNSLEEKAVERLKKIFNMSSGRISDRLHLTSMTSWDEDVTTTSYLEALAKKAGWKTKYVDLEHIGADEDKASPGYGWLLDQDDEKIEILYKLMPWEHLFETEYSKYIARDETMFIEPPWRALMSNKMLSVVLWEMFPGHPNLLPSFTTPEPLGDTYVEKPIFGRIGAAISIVKDGVRQKPKDFDPEEDLTAYDKYPKIYQQYSPLPEMPGMPGWHYQAGIWMVGDEVAGMDVRVDNQEVTGSSKMKFLPHIMIPHGKKLALK